MKQSTWIHLRFPFSFFLMPVFLFALGVVPEPVGWQVALVFFILHFLVYPASNGYNSYYDKDEESIGGVENPPPVSPELWRVSILMDVVAVGLSLFIDLYFALAVLVYGLISKAYSYDKIRLKKYPFISWITIGVFQGAFTFWMIYWGVGAEPTWASLSEGKVAMAALLSTVMLLGSYPMTQVYQHSEDSKRGDKTLSLILGIRGTFLFTNLVFGGVAAAYFFYFWHYQSLYWAVGFELALLPVLIYFFSWFYKVWFDERAANFKSTMMLNLISAVCLNLYFLSYYLLKV